MMTAARFRNEDAAREHLENIRWPDGAAGGQELRGAIMWAGYTMYNVIIIS